MKFLIAVIVSMAILYLIASFVSLTLNPHNWSLEARVVYGTVGTLVSLLVAAVLNDEPSTNPND